MFWVVDLSLSQSQWLCLPPSILPEATGPTGWAGEAQWGGPQPLTPESDLLVLLRVGGGGAQRGLCCAKLALS